MSDNNGLIKVSNEQSIDQPYIQYKAPYVPGLEDQRDDETHLRDYWRVLIKRKWMVLTVFVVLVTIAVISSFKATPIYKATAKVEIESEKTNVLPYKEVVEQGTTTIAQDQYLQTQFKILQSRSLAKRVIDALNLKDNRDFNAGATTMLSSMTSRIKSFFVRKAVQTQEEMESSAESGLINKFLANLEITPVRNSRLVEVGYYSANPKLAADIANTLSNEYIQQNFESKFDATQRATDFLSKQLVTLKAKVEKSEDELMKYSQAHDILGLDDKQNVIVRTLVDLNDSLTRAQADKLKKESMYSIVKGFSSANFPDMLKNPLISELERRLATLKQEQAKMNASFRPGWPELDQINSQITQVESQLDSEKGKAIKAVEVDYITAVRQESLLRSALEKQKTEASRLNQNAIQYNILKREVDANKQLYEGLLQRMKEAGISAGLKSSNIRIVDNSEVPTLPDRPKKSVNILLGAAIGLILGVALAFFLEYMDNSVKTPEDIDRFIRVPSLGVIPSLASIYDRKRLYGYGYGHRSESHKQRQDQNGTPEVSMIAHTNSDSIISEAYRSLRTSILLSNSGKPPKTILVTSAHKAEGKTVSSVNIAISLAQLGGRVLLLDCDMRNPNCHKALKVKNEQGMSSFLAANVDISSLIVETKVPNLFLVTAGKIPPNPAELLASPRMKQALTLVDEFFDYVVVDSPPMLAVTDALILSTIVDGVVLVVKAEATPKDVLQKARKSLQGVNAKVLGVLINQADVRGADYNYYYKYYYAYGYGADKDGRNDAA